MNLFKLGSIPVQVSDWAPEDKITVMGDFSTPDNWYTMSEEEKFDYAVTHGGTIIVHTEYWEKIRNVSSRLVGDSE